MTLVIFGLFSFNYFCDSRNNIETARRSFFQTNMFVNRATTGKDSDILFGSEYKREIRISQMSTTVSLVSSRARKRASVNYAFARRIHL